MSAPTVIAPCFAPADAELAPARPGLYLHLPFCSALCPYCDFAVVVGGGERRHQYLEALAREIELYRDTSAVFDTVYLGGGTPSSLSAAELERLLAALRRTFMLAADVSVTLEANPEDVDAARVRQWRRLGIDRLSLGVQSFADDELRWLGRRHSAAAARRSVELAHHAGFASLSIDLIYALPGSSPARWRDTLEVAVGLSPHHLSCYELTIHAATAFGRRARRGELVELPEGERAELFTLTHDWLERAGYPAYEVSSFARGREHRSRHNQKYWRHVAYLGLGLSAHSFAGGRRWWNERGLGAYLARLRRGHAPIAGEERLAGDSLVLEALMLGLRTVDGVDLNELERRFGVALRRRNQGHIAALVADGLLLDDGDHLRPSRRGLALADRLATGFELGA